MESNAISLLKSMTDDIIKYDNTFQLLKMVFFLSKASNNNDLCKENTKLY